MDNKIIKAILKINPNAEVSVSEEDINKIEQEEENAETKKTSGKQKLKDLGLNDDEIKALMGV